ncbi:MAG: type II secretion system protein GspG [Candidatus Omnitrophica bacterium]|nr:type II secretion system protein GspG [Candidatus Omnitrophota bacterium]
MKISLLVEALKNIKEIKIKKSFTLIELIVVIAIIAILAAIIAPNAFRAIEKAKISATVQDFKSFKTATQAYYADVGKWPWEGAVWNPPNWDTSNGEGYINNDGASGWDGPYLEGWPKANWGMDFVCYYYLSDWDADGIAESHFVSIRKNAFVTPTGNSTALPEHVRQRIDEILDDGDLDTGKLQMASDLYFDYLLVR